MNGPEGMTEPSDSTDGLRARLESASGVIPQDLIDRIINVRETIRKVKETKRIDRESFRSFAEEYISTYKEMDRLQNILQEDIERMRMWRGADGVEMAPAGCSEPAPCLSPPRFLLVLSFAMSAHARRRVYEPAWEDLVRMYAEKPPCLSGRERRFLACLFRWHYLCLLCQCFATMLPGSFAHLIRWLALMALGGAFPHLYRRLAELLPKWF